MRKKILDEVRAARRNAARTPADESLEQTVPVAVFHAEVAAWAKRIGVTPKEIRLRPLKRKWASCSSRGRITFDTALLQQPARQRAAVIVHELLHLRVPNHGKLFKALSRAYLPDADASETLDRKETFARETFASQSSLAGQDE